MNHAAPSPEDDFDELAGALIAVLTVIQMFLFVIDFELLPDKSETAKDTRRCAWHNAVDVAPEAFYFAVKHKKRSQKCKCQRLHSVM